MPCHCSLGVLLHQGQTRNFVREKIKHAKKSADFVSKVTTSVPVVTWSCRCCVVCLNAAFPTQLRERSVPRKSNQTNANPASLQPTQPRQPIPHERMNVQREQPNTPTSRRNESRQHITPSDPLTNSHFRALRAPPLFANTSPTSLCGGGISPLAKKATTTTTTITTAATSQTTDYNVNFSIAQPTRLRLRLRR